MTVDTLQTQYIENLYKKYTQTEPLPPSNFCTDKQVTEKFHNTSWNINHVKSFMRPVVVQQRKTYTQSKTKSSHKKYTSLEISLNYQMDFNLINDPVLLTISIFKGPSGAVILPLLFMRNQSNQLMWTRSKNRQRNTCYHPSRLNGAVYSEGEAP